MTAFVQNLLAVGLQVLVLFVLIGCGALARRTKTLDDASIRGATALLLNFVTPCLLISTFQREYSPDQLATIGLAAAIGFGFHAISIVLAYLFLRDSAPTRDAVLKFALIFTNAGFMSLPLQKEVLGDDGVFCGAVVVGVFQILCWTLGIWLMGGRDAKISWRKIAFNPGIIGIAVALAFFLLRIHLPAPIARPCHMMGELNTPLAMTVIGYHLAGARFTGYFRDRLAMRATALRLFVSPLILVGILALFGTWDRTLLVAAVISASAPSAALCTVLAVQYRRDVALSVMLVAVSTLASVVSMPLIVALADTLLSR